FNFEKWRPVDDLLFLKKPKDESNLTIKGFQIKATPQYVFQFQRNKVNEIGAIWFVAKLKGFTEDELGMFSDILYTYLKTHFSKQCNINPQYCIAVDVFNNFDINYAQLQNSKISAILIPTLEELKKFM